MLTLKSGGVKLDEPNIDLAVAVAIASSWRDLPTNPQECLSVKLVWLVNATNRIEQRINEAAKLAFTVYAPKNFWVGLKFQIMSKLLVWQRLGKSKESIF